MLFVARTILPGHGKNKQRLNMIKVCYNFSVNLTKNVVNSFCKQKLGTIETSLLRDFRDREGSEEGRVRRCGGITFIAPARTTGSRVLDLLKETRTII
jgi:hypothetical protein